MAKWRHGFLLFRSDPYPLDAAGEILQTILREPIVASLKGWGFVKTRTISSDL